jgi:hypothetical protein
VLTFYAAERSAAGGIDHRVANGQAKAATDRAQPMDFMGRTTGISDPWALGVRLRRKPGPIRLKTKNEVAALPVVADLTTTDEAGLVGRNCAREAAVSRRGVRLMPGHTGMPADIPACPRRRGRHHHRGRLGRQVGSHCARRKSSGARRGGGEQKTLVLLLHDNPLPIPKLGSRLPAKCSTGNHTAALFTHSPGQFARFRTSVSFLQR